MTFFDTTLPNFLSSIGIHIGSLGIATKIVGMFGIFMLLVLGVVLIGLGYVARRAKSYPKWIGTYAMGLTSVSLLLWVLIPGWPLASTIGLIVGLVGAVLTVIVYRKGLEPKMAGMLCLVLGIVNAAFALLIGIIEIYGGGGFLG